MNIDINFLGITFSISEISYILPDFFSLIIEKAIPNIIPINKLAAAILFLLGETRFSNNVGLVITVSYTHLTLPTRTRV